MTATKYIKTTELQAGNIVHFYGARFEVLSIRMITDKDPKNGFVMTSQAKWLDGAEVRGYFGSKVADLWNFQGNDLARVTIEA